MIIKKIAKQCRDFGKLNVTYQPDGTLWIGSGLAIYGLENMQPLTALQIAEMFDYGHKTLQNMTLSDDVYFPIQYIANDTYGTDCPLTNCRMIEICGMKMRIYKSDDGLLFVPDDLFSPLKNEFENGASVYERGIIISGKQVEKIIIVRDLFVRAVIFPAKISAKTLQKWCEMQAEIITDIDTEIEYMEQDEAHETAVCEDNCEQMKL